MSLKHWSVVDFEQWPAKVIKRDAQTVLRLYARYGLAGILHLLAEGVEDEQDAWLIEHWLYDDT